MGKRTYDQFCPVARALDVLGERWALLVVRELIFGQKRYTDLVNGLPGVGANVLAARLKELQTAGIVRRTTLPPPAASTVYELTELGRGLEPAIVDLAKWGLNLLDTPKTGDRPQLGWYMAVMQRTFRPEAARGVDETYEFRVGEDVFHVHVDDGAVEVRAGNALRPDLIWSSDFKTFFVVGSRQLSPGEAVARGRATIEGDLSVCERMIEILGRKAPDVVAQSA